MNVTISVPGSFHAFELAEQLDRRNALRRIYTSFPRFMFDPGTVPTDKISPIRYPEAVVQLADRLPWGTRLPAGRWKNRLFDRAVARRLQSTEDGLFVGFAGCSRDAIRRANALGMTTAVERSSAHIRVQDELLREEYRDFGLETDPIDPVQIEREEQEYADADYVVTPSTFVAETFFDQGTPPENVICEPLGVDPQPVDRPAEGPDDPFTVLFVGRVGLRKGVRYLLDAWDSLALDDAELVVVGPHVSDAGREIVRAYRDDESVRVRGYVDDLQAVYRQASAFVLPSIEDGFGRVVLEAMAAGLPVVVSENVGAKDCVRDEIDGLIVPARDASAIAGALERLYANPSERSKMGRRARSRVESTYTWDEYGNRIVERYGEMTG